MMLQARSNLRGLTGTAGRVLVPRLRLTTVVDASNPEAVKVVVPTTKVSASQMYYTAPKMQPLSGFRRDGLPNEVPHKLNLFPLVVGGDGVPWAEANMWLLFLASSSYGGVSTALAGNANDLAGYLRFLEETGIDWLEFPKSKILRPTYRFHAHLKHSIANSEIAHSTARRRMATVIRFYRWLRDEKILCLEHEPWKEREKIVFFKDWKGFQSSIAVTTTDVSIKHQVVDDPYDGLIEDGGKLRPLPQIEQEWLLDALFVAGNTEMTLIHLFGLLTGARIQSILTFKVRHVLLDTESLPKEVLRFPIGPGTGVDTKSDKKIVLHIPVWFYELLQHYAVSARAKRRRMRAVGGDTEDQYLFLSIRGAPFYYSKDDSTGASDASGKHYGKAGQAVWQFKTEKVIPYIREAYGDKNFHYRFHDTRATFGMNMTDVQLALVEKGEVTLKQAFDFVRTRMAHESLVTTERYLNYRSRMKQVRAAQDGWEANLHMLAEKASFQYG
ncbi:integrase [Chromobacterium violaceum]|uniref:integrase n=1 Tax=Chromobacterium violaceum TaxID=536 RepID=UPI0015F8A6D6|nr:integrase [Chromobacterium violaceum]MBA8735798.1 integrase [Chromobacterium violaceum]